MTTALTAPSIASAKQITMKTTLRNYGGRPAFLAFYVTDKKGAYVGTLWMAGFAGQLTTATCATGTAPPAATRRNISGITGASVGPGRSLTITVDLADSLFDAGYTLHIDAAAEDYARKPLGRDDPADQTLGRRQERLRAAATSQSFHYSM